MKFEIYYDLQFLIVMVTFFCTTYLTNQTLDRSITVFRILTGAALGAAAYVAVVFLPLRSIMKAGVWFLCTCAMVCLVFGVRRLRNILKVLETYWICSAAWGSSVALTYRIGVGLFGVKKGIPFLLLIEALATMGGCEAVRRMKGALGRREGWAWLEADGEKRRYQAFVDTGNSLREPISGKPVCVLRAASEELRWTEKTLFRVIPYKTVGASKGILHAYCVSKLYLDLGGPVKCIEDAYVAVVTMDKGEDTFAGLIVHPKILSEKAKGKRKGERT